MKAIKELVERPQWVAYTADKIPISPRGTRASSTDPGTWGTLDEAKHIRRVQGLPGVGFVLTDEDPWVCVDLDDAIDPIADEVRPWAREIVQELDSYTELSPSGLGLHIWMRGTLPRPGARRHDDKVKIEAYRSRRYLTVTGQHLPGTPDEIREVDLSGWHDRWWPRDARSSLGGIEWQSSDVGEWILDALSHIPAEGYDVWTRVGMGLHSHFGEAGAAIFDAWSSTGSTYAGSEATLRKYRTLGGTAVQIGTVIRLAQDGGFVVPRPKVVLDEEFVAGLAGFLERSTRIEDTPEESVGLGLRLYEAATLYADTTPPEPDLIGPGVLSAGDLMLLFGPPKSMKSMVVMDMCRAFAAGREWCGFTVSRPLTTVWLNLEVKIERMRDRLQLADMDEEELEAVRDRLHITDRCTPVLDASFVAEFAAAAQKSAPGGVDLIVIDPLANIYTGESENDPAEMARFLRAVKVLRNQVAPEAAVILVHHANKTNRKDRNLEPFNSIRGSSVLRGAYDAGIYLDRDEEVVGAIDMWCELRNGAGQPRKRLHFSRGRFAEELEMPEELVQPIDHEREMVERIIRMEAARGVVMTPRAFRIAYQGGELGHDQKIRGILDRLFAQHVLGLFSEIPELGIEPPGGGGKGYLWTDGMLVNVGGKKVAPAPEWRKNRGDGKWELWE